jgi:L-threonylcarbamoyladenylate synthase
MSDDPQIAQAAEILRRGGLVAFPTETVYGLGADARNAQAVQKTFRAKGRPGTNPLICHVADIAAARQIVKSWPPAAERLAQRYWPGPLTLVLPKSNIIGPLVTAGLPNVAVRVPAHPIALALLQAFNGPIAAPSANRSGAVSPTTAQHVQSDLCDLVDLILDGGPCTVGIESTVLTLATDPPKILRPGNITRAEIESTIGRVEMTTQSIAPTTAAQSPGQHAQHYAPTTPTYRYEPQEAPDAVAAMSRFQTGVHLLVGAGLLPIAAVRTFKMIELPHDPAACAADLYATLRQADAMNTQAILIRMPLDNAAWSAIRDRLTRAAKPITDLPSVTK